MPQENTVHANPDLEKKINLLFNHVFLKWLSETLCREGRTQAEEQFNMIGSRDFNVDNPPTLAEKIRLVALLNECCSVRGSSDGSNLICRHLEIAQDRSDIKQLLFDLLTYLSPGENENAKKTAREKIAKEMRNYFEPPRAFYFDDDQLEWAFSPLNNLFSTKRDSVLFVNRIINHISQHYHKYDLNKPDDQGYRRVTNLINRLKEEINKLEAAETDLAIFQSRKELLSLLLAGIFYESMGIKKLSNHIRDALRIKTSATFRRLVYHYVLHYNAWPLTTERTLHYADVGITENLKVNLLSYELSDLPIGPIILPAPNQYQKIIEELCDVALNALNEYIAKELHGVGMEGSRRALNALEFLNLNYIPNRGQLDIVLQKELVMVLCSIVLKHKSTLGNLFLNDFKKNMSDFVPDQLNELQRAFYIPDTALVKIDEGMWQYSPTSIIDLSEKRAWFFHEQMTRAVKAYLAENRDGKNPHDARGINRATHFLNELDRIKRIFQGDHARLPKDFQKLGVHLSHLFCAIAHGSDSTKLKKKLIHYTGHEEFSEFKRSDYHEVSGKELTALTPAPEGGWAKLKNTVCEGMRKFHDLQLGYPHEQKTALDLSKACLEIQIRDDDYYEFGHQSQQIKKFLGLLNSVLISLQFEFCGSVNQLASDILCFAGLEDKPIKNWVLERFGSYPDMVTVDRDAHRYSQSPLSLGEIPDVAILKNALLAIKENYFLDIVNQIQENVADYKTKIVFLVSYVVNYQRNIVTHDMLLMHIGLSASQVNEMVKRYHLDLSDEMRSATLKAISERQSNEIKTPFFVDVPVLEDCLEKLMAAVDAILSDKTASALDRITAKNLQKIVKEITDPRDFILWANVVRLHKDLSTLSKCIHQYTGFDDFNLLYQRDAHGITKKHCEEKLSQLTKVSIHAEHFKQGLIDAATAYLQTEKGRCEGSGNCRANNLLSTAQAIDIHEEGCEKKLLILASAVVLHTSEKSDLRDKILQCTECSKEEMMSLVTCFGVTPEEGKKMAKDLTPSTQPTFFQKRRVVRVENRTECGDSLELQLRNN